MTETWKEWEGQVVDSQFCLLQYLASSEHSAVFLTKYGDPKSQNAAIKLVREDSANSAFQLARWELAAKLSHPNLVRLFHFGRCRLNNTRLLYVVMEYAEEDLSQVLPNRPLTGAESRELLAAALDALTYLHGKGFVHGHLKPANIMSVADQLKISSDGVYQDQSNGWPVILNAYDAPELATGGGSTASDIWSIGAILVEVLTLELPGLKDIQKDPILPDRIPTPFLDIVQHCLRRDPKHRWTIDEIAARLQQISPVPEEQGRDGSKRASVRRRYLVPVAAVGLALAAIVVGRSLLKPRESIRPAFSGSFTPPVAQERGKPVPATPELSHPTETSNEELGLSKRSPASSLVRSEGEGAMPSDGAAAGEVINQVLPDVPTKARASIQGRVKVSVRVRVDPSGNVLDAKLDSAGPSKYFANLAMQAAQRWKFRPTKTDGGVVLNEWVLRFEFLRNSTKVLAVRARSR